VTTTRRGTPTVYRSVAMRSRLEAMVASWLDNRQLRWEYEPACFADERGQYYPDFRVEPVRIMGVENAHLYLEVKPDDLGGFTAAELLDRMQSIWSSDPTAFLAVCSTNPTTFNTFPIRWQTHETWEVHDAVWVRCRKCGKVGVESTSRLGQAFVVDGVPTTEPWSCPTCRRNAGFTIDVPWVSAEYHAMVDGRRIA
jgi:hypothetical protein